MNRLKLSKLSEFLSSSGSEFQIVVNLLPESLTPIARTHNFSKFRVNFHLFCTVSTNS